MATAPKGSKPSKTTKASTRSRTTKPKKPVEDAVVIEDLPPVKPDEKPAVAKPAPAPEKAAKPAAEAKPTEADRAAKHEAAAKPSDPPAKPAPKPAPEKRRGGFGAMLGLVTGGILAAVIGFAAARTVVPEGWPFPGVAPEVDPLAAVVEAQGVAIASLGTNAEAHDAAISALETDDTVDVLRGETQGQFAALQDRLTATAARLDEIDERLGAVERMAPEGSEAAVRAAEAYERELETLRRMFDAELASLSAAQEDAMSLEVDAAASARAAAGRAALARVTAALDTGKAFDEALFDFGEATGIEAPTALSDVAGDGVPTLAALQDGFPEAARAAIDDATRAAVEDGSVSRWSAFLQTQLGTRSIEPREGDDADAVLSRAEAALKQGDVAAALGEVTDLPEAARPAMNAWQAAATARADALAAGAALAQELNAK